MDVNCNVTQVRVTPCAEAAENKPCVIKRGKTAKIDFDFVPGGSYEGLETRAYWASTTGDLPWIGMDTNGCSYTECPTNPKPEVFSYDLKIGSKLPVVSNWKLSRYPNGRRSRLKEELFFRAKEVKWKLKLHYQLLSVRVCSFFAYFVQSAYWLCWHVGAVHNNQNRFFSSFS